MTVFHFIITFQDRAGNTGTMDGAISLGPQDTRTTALTQIREHVRKQSGVSGFNILFFSLERDALV